MSFHLRRCRIQLGSIQGKALPYRRLRRCLGHLLPHRRLCEASGRTLRVHPFGRSVPYRYPITPGRYSIVLTSSLFSTGAGIWSAVPLFLSYALSNFTNREQRAVSIAIINGLGNLASTYRSPRLAVSRDFERETSDATRPLALR